MKTNERVFKIIFASVYPHYVAKAKKKGRKKSEVDAVICWLTGYSQRELEASTRMSQITPLIKVREGFSLGAFLKKVSRFVCFFNCPSNSR